MSINKGEVPEKGSREKFERLKAELRGYKTIALAFSGGVDSSFLLAAAKASGLERVLAVTLVSQFFTRAEKIRAQELAHSMGVEQISLDLDILSVPDVVANDAKRCYFCKQKGFSLVKELADKQGIKTLVHGINLDDLGDFRPGIEAANQLGFKAPLVDVGFSKQEIRRCSRQMGLRTWNLPSQSCLATRIPSHEKITQRKLDQVETAETFLHEMGFVQVRVRCHGALARIETNPEDISRLADPGIRKSVSRALKRLGFDFVSIDLEGYRTGKMNVKGVIDKE